MAQSQGESDRLWLRRFEGVVWNRAEEEAEEYCLIALGAKVMHPCTLCRLVARHIEPLCGTPSSSRARGDMESSPIAVDRLPPTGERIVNIR